MNHRVLHGSGCLSLAGAVFLLGCGKEVAKNMTVSSLAPVSEQGLQAVSKKKIFFGHQSVGYDIVQGIADVTSQYPAISLRVVESAAPEAFAAPVLAHARVGRNSDPESKIREFGERVRAGIGGRADIATFKFCYADFERNTDAVRVFERYRTAMAELAAAYPATRFVHITVPLKATSRGWKTHIKNLLGRPHAFIPDNARRQEYNELMRKHYAGREPLFDLAGIEATDADGSLSFDKFQGKAVPSMVNAYTYDSGHLNERGRRLVAERFLALLASL
jgi:hypothetical protein